VHRTELVPDAPVLGQAIAFRPVDVECRHGLTVEKAVDTCWTLNSPELYVRLVVRCGWAPDAFQAWLARQLQASLLPRDA
jgi:hypothetical protein